MNEMKSLRVLYIEDDDGARDALCQFLKPRVGKLYSAASAEDGLKKFEEYRPNFLIVDLILPGMSGLDFITAARERDKTVKVLIISTVSEIQTILDAVNRRIEHYVLKPIDTEDLERKMTAIGGEILNNAKDIHNIRLSNPGQIEDMVRRHFITMLKTYTGKGPMDLKTLLINQTMELHVFDGFTLMEKRLLADRRHVSLVEQCRKLLYEGMGPELEEFIQNTAGVDARLVSVQVDGIKKVDKLVLTLGKDM